MAINTGNSLLTVGGGIKVVTNGLEYSSSCVRSPSTCNAYVTVYFTIENNSTNPYDVRFVSTSVPLTETASSYNNTGGWITGYFSMGVGNSPLALPQNLEVDLVSGSSQRYKSNNFIINLDSTAAVVPPSVFFATPSAGTCTYDNPYTSCSASTSSIYSVSNYVDGTLSIEYVSGSSSILAVRTGSESNGSYNFSATVGSNVSTVFRLKLVATSGTYYSSNVTVSINATLVPTLVLWLDMAVGTNYINAVNSSQIVQSVTGLQSSVNPVSSSLGSFHDQDFPAGLGSSANTFNYSSNPIVISNNFSVCCWVKNTTITNLTSGNTLSIIGLDDINICLTGVSYMSVKTDGVLRFQDSVNQVNDSWKFYAFVFRVVATNTIVIDVYLNGALLTTTSSFTFSIATGVIYNMSGKNYTDSGGSVNNLSIDSLCVYKKVLSASEVNYLYNDGTGRTYTNSGFPI